MLVDDDATLRTLLRVTLPSDGFEVIEAADGAEALQLLDEQLPDLVVLDWNMPERSGAEVLADLKRRDASVPVIVLTAGHDDRRRAVARTLGADEFLTKPFSPLRLLDAIERLIADRLPNQPA
jgi:DNA-binding response OmpR family regulator